MDRLRFVLMAAAVAVGAGGCAGLQKPNWFSPGPAEVQQNRAARFDPYPETDVGPAIVGGRPREYQKPLAEPRRARFGQPRWMKW